MTKTCSLKGKQKLFFLQLNQAASCCRADPISLVDKTLDDCVELWNNESTQLIQGVELPGCRHCWQAEQTGQQSYRQQMTNVDTNYVEIFVSNLCNQMCSYCSPKFSSAWNDNILQHGKFNSISKSTNANIATVNVISDTQDWLSQIEQHLNQGPVSIKLLGGEPLMQKRNLQRLLEFNTDQIDTLNINTNLNPPNNKFLKWVLETFPSNKLQFEISLDTTPEHNAVPRAGFDRSKFEENLNLLEQYNVSFLFLSVVSILNIFSIGDYQKWLSNRNYHSRFFRINNPDFLDPSYLPEHFKTLIYTDTLPEPAIQSLNYTPSNIDLKRFEQYNYLNQYFQRTNTVITDQRLVDYFKWLKENYEDRSRK